MTFFCLLLILLLYKRSGVDSLIISCWVFFLVKILESPCLLWCKGLGRCSHYNDSLWAGQSRDWIPVGVRFSSRLALVPTQPPVQWVPAVSWGWSGQGVALTFQMNMFFLKEISSLKNFLLHSVMLHKNLFNVTWIVHTLNVSYTCIVLLINHFFV